VRFSLGRIIFRFEKFPRKAAKLRREVVRHAIKNIFGIKFIFWLKSDRGRAGTPFRAGRHISRSLNKSVPANDANGRE